MSSMMSPAMMSGQLFPVQAPSMQLIPDRAIAAPTTAATRPVPHQANSRGTEFLVKGGVCSRRAIKSRTKSCSVEGCTNQSKGGGVCRRHGAKVKKCGVEGCGNVSRKAGLCIRHGARKRPCKVEGCTNNARKGGVCIAHGSKEKLKLCREDGCAKRVWNKGVCWRHREGAKAGAMKGAKELDYDSDDLGAEIYQAIMLRREW